MSRRRETTPSGHGRKSLWALVLGGGLALAGLLWSDGHAPGHHVHPGVDGAHQHHHHPFTGPHHHPADEEPTSVEAPAVASESASPTEASPPPASDPAPDDQAPPSTATVVSSGGTAEAPLTGPTTAFELSISDAEPWLRTSFPLRLRPRDGGGPRAPPA